MEGSLSLIIQCSLYADLAQVAEGEEKENAHLLLELLTPIAKSFPAEKGVDSVSAGMQVLGGAGYTDDFPLEQIYRDIRVNAIYEGTTTIHGMDLLGRKLMMAKGKAAKLYFAEIQKVVVAAMEVPNLQPHAKQLMEHAKGLHATTMHLTQLAMTDRPEVFLSDASLYLEYFGTVCIAWQWLKQGLVAQANLETAESDEDRNFYQGKLFALRYYFEYELTKVKGMHDRLHSSDRLTLDIEEDFLKLIRNRKGAERLSCTCIKYSAAWGENRTDLRTLGCSTKTSGIVLSSEFNAISVRSASILKSS